MKHYARTALWLCFVVLGPSTPASAGDFLQSLLPSWPLVNAGDPIPANLVKLWSNKGDSCPGLKGHFSAFPSKGNANPEAPADPTKPDGPKIKETRDYRLDHDDICDDGDQTTYNGLLCASGDSGACRSIAESQDNEGRWFRSPHRRWMWENRCFDKTFPLATSKFNDNCAYGFSPDMNLGVLLYTLKTKDVRRYSAWLRWLNTNASKTKLCKLDEKREVIEGSCEKIEWPRVCTDDLGHLNPNENPGYDINGRYGGKCALRPWDALDFSAVNEATATAPPTRMSSWEVESRALIGASKQLLNGAPVIGAPLSQTPTLLIMSSVEGTNFPLHLDAVRVLIRMMIRNPSLELNTLPTLPGPDDLPGLLGIAASDATDPLSIKTAAAIIAARASWNPFYQLLSEGPTSNVRSLILERCPANESDSVQKTDWLWEKDTHKRDDGTLDNDRQHGMGWDCAFVGNLYNKMRVKKSTMDELFSLFRRYADVLGNSLKQLTQALQLAETANALAEKAVDEAERDLSTAQDFVNAQYDQQRKIALDRVNSLTAQLSQLAQQQSALQSQVSSLRSSAASLPDQIVTQVTDRVCKTLPWPASELCNNVTRTISVVNQTKQNMLGQVRQLEKQVADIRDQTIVSTQSRLSEAQQLVNKLDEEVQAAQNKLQKQVLQTAVRIAKTDLQLKAHILSETRKGVSEVRRANSRVNSYLCVWKNDSKCDA
ncbi:hypothetical protein [Bradyrhizobium sp. Bra64]|uniref:hypothetical protein n=1 Tax=Bradyrhizobium sp. Bra64 TaxID=2926009 RepID=UPI002119B23A|nr:hypothetical protein [Bradyrhizobium sp. Bra64]